MSKLKKHVYRNQKLSKIIKPVYHTLRRSRNFSSKEYWDTRYRKGGSSGAGSYGRLAKFKADFLNDFAAKKKINSVIELGCGDGSQLRLFKFKNYVGLDVSKESIRLCIERYTADKTKSFLLYDPNYFVDKHNLLRADASMSLDVIYHLVEDGVFEKYMHDLFSMSKKYVIIYSSDTDANRRTQAQHVRHRKFTDWVRKNIRGWELDLHEKNKHSLEHYDEIDESFADFYIYKKNI